MSEVAHGVDGVAHTPRWRARVAVRALAAIALLVALVPILPGGIAHALPTPGTYCFVVSDGTDRLSTVIKTDTNPATNETDIGSGLGVSGVEAIAYDAVSGVLYAADANRLGVINTTTGVFSARPSTFGSGSGSAGTVSFSDVDGLAFNPYTGALYGAVRRGASGEADALIRINPVTGAHVPGAFGTGVDYVLITPVGGLDDIDDLTFDLTDGQLYGVANDGGTGDRLVRINVSTGATTDVGTFGVGDVEGLSVDTAGQLWGTTGTGGTSATRDSLYPIDKATAGLVGPARRMDNGSDYEAVACNTGGVNTISGQVFRDTNYNGSRDGGEPAQAGALIDIYRDPNNNGVIDAGESLVVTLTTAADGSYSTTFSGYGGYIIDVRTASLPSPHILTTTARHRATFGNSVGQTDANNDFGFNTPSADLALTKSHTGSFTRGSTGTYTIGVTNNGPSSATAPVTVTDTLPAGLTFQSASGAGWSCSASGQTVTCTRSTDLASGASAPINLTVAVAESTASSVTNTASVTSTRPDHNGANNSASDPTTVASSADLRMQKSGPATVNAGGSVTYTLTVTNLGPSTAADVTVTDPLPAGLQNPTTSSPGCSISGGTLTCLVGALANTAFSTATVTGTAAPNATSLSNTATASSSTPDPVSANNAATVTTSVTGQADLSLTKSHTGSFTRGSTATFTLTARNDGPSDVTGAVTVTDTLPAGLTYQSVSGAGWSCSASGQTVTCTLAAGLSSGASSSFQMTVAVGESTASSVTNTASVSSSVADPVPGNNGASDPVTVGSSADLRVAKSGPATAAAGSTVTYSIVVTNLGPSTAASVSLSDPIPANLGSPTTPTAGCSISGGTLSCALGSMTSGASTTVTLSGTAPASGTISNTATVSSPTPDPVGANNSSTAQTTVEPRADLSLTKSHTGDFRRGSTGTYTLTVTNNGPSTAAAPVTITDTLPAGLSYQSASGAGWSCSASGQTVTCTRSTDLANAGSSAVSLTVAVAESTAASVTNTASVTSATTDPVPGNNSASDPTTVASEADLTLVKSHSGSFVRGSTGTYTLVVQNDGPSVASGPITLTDTLPAGLTYQSASGAGWSCSASGQTVTCTNASSMASTGSSSLSLTVAVGAGTAGSVTNSATVSSPTTDPNALNNSDTDPTTVVDPAPGAIGDLVWADWDRDGVKDPAEPGLAATVTLTRPDGSTATTTSDASTGAYLFSGLPPAAGYTVVVTSPGGTATTPTSYTVTVPAGTTVDTADFGFDREPTAVDDSASTPFDTPVTVDVTANDTAGDGSSTWAKATDPSNGTVSCTAGGSCTYTPNSGFSGTDSFTYTITDVDGDADTATVTVTVGQPGAVGDLVWADYDRDQTRNGAEPGLAATVTLTRPDGSTTSTTSNASTGAYLFSNLTPGSYTVAVTDPGGVATTPTSYTVTVTAGNTVSTADFGFDRSPTAANDSTATPFGTPVTVDVTTNDTAGDGSSTWAKATDPSNGTVSCTAGGSCTYTPNAGFSGTDSFTYTITDVDGDTDTATVTVVVGAPASIGDLVWADYDRNGSQNGAEPGLAATVRLLGPGGLDRTTTSDASTGAYSFTNLIPGTYTVSVTSPGGTATTPVTYTRTLAAGENHTAADFGFDRAPVAVADSASTPFATPVTVDVTPNDLAGDGASTWAKATDPANGVVSCTSGGSCTYTPNSGFSGTDSFTYTISDVDGDVSTATVTVTVGQPGAIGDLVWADYDRDQTRNGAEPGLAATVTLTRPDGSTTTTTSNASTGAYLFANLTPGRYMVAVTSPGGVATTPTSYTVDVTAGNTFSMADFGFDREPTANDDTGSATFNTPTSVNVAANDTAGDGTSTFAKATDPANGTVSCTSAGSCTYAPTAGFSGTDSFTYTITDVDGDADTATVTITVGQPGAVGDLVWADWDRDGAQNGSEPGLAATVTLTRPDGSTTSTTSDASTGAYAFTSLVPGRYTVAVTSPGGTATTPSSYTVDVVAGASVSTADFGFDRSPVGGHDAASTPFRTPVTVGVAANDTAGDGTSTFAKATDPTNGSVTCTAAGSCTYTPNPAFSGSDSFTYTITDVDGDSDTATVRITVGQPGAIGDLVWADWDRDMTQDPLEPGLAATVTLTRPDGSTATTTSSAATGAYSFTQLVPGRYTVAVTSPGGIATTPTSYTVDVTAGNTVSTADFGFDRVPAATDDSATALFATPVTVDVTTNDTAGDGSSSWTKATDPANGTVSCTSGGSCTYTPGATFSGTDSFTYTISDVDGDTDTATVTVTVGQPGAIGDLVWADWDRNGSQNGSEPGSAATVTLTRPDGSTTSTTSNASTGAYLFSNLTPGRYTVAVTSPGGVATTAISYTVDVTAGNTVSTADFGFDRVPDAVADRASTPFNTPVTVDVTPNDIAGDGSSTWAKATDPANGTVSCTAGGSCTYTPNSGFQGSDTFTYTISDVDGDTDTATVTIVVGTPAFIGDLVWADYNRNGVRDPGEPGLAATVTLSGADSDTATSDATTGAYSFGPLTPGAYTVTVTSPGGTATTATTYSFTLAAGDNETSADFGFDRAPVAMDDSATTPFQTAVVVDVAANDTAGDGTSTFTKTTDPANGTVACTSGGSCTYTPDAGFSGTDSFTYTITDVDGDISTATVTVTAGQPGAIGDLVWADYDRDQTRNGAEPGLAATVTLTRPDGSTTSTTSNASTGAYLFDNLTPGRYTVAVTSPGGVATTATSHTVDVTAGSTVSTADFGFDRVPAATDDSATTPFATPVTVDVTPNDTAGDGSSSWAKATDPANGTVSCTAGGSCTYTPDAGFSGTDSFTYTITDVDGDISTATVTVTAGQPGAIGDLVWADYDRDQTRNGAEPGLAATVTLTRPDGSTTSTTSNASTGAYLFSNLTPGRYTVAVTSPGGVATTPTSHTVDVTAGNTVSTADFGFDRVPAATDDSATTPFATPVTVDVTPNDTAGDGSSTWAKATDPANGTASCTAGGSCTYTPSAGFSGTDSFTYTVSDVDGDTQTATVTITVGQPGAVGDLVWADYDRDGAENGSEPGLAATVTLTRPDGSTASTTSNASTGAYLFDNLTPGRYTVAVTSPGGVATTPTSHTVDVTAGNTVSTADFGFDREPTAADDSAGVPFNNPATIDVAANDTAGDGTSTFAKATDPANGTVSCTSAGSCTYTPNSGFSGTDSFTYTITDVDGDVATATVTLTVRANTAPTAVDDQATTPEDTPVTIGVLPNDSDPDGDPLTITGSTPPSNGKVSCTATACTYTPNAGFNGTDTFTYTVSDGFQGTATATVTVVVTPVNDPPAFTSAPTNISQVIQVGQTPAPVAGTDPDGDVVSYQLVGGTLPPGLTLNPDGTFSGLATTPGTYTVDLRVCDDGSPVLCGPQVLTIVVEAATSADPMTRGVQVTRPALARTGVEALALVRVGTAFLTLGLLLVIGARRRCDGGSTA